jgi:hypothetical protein
VDDPPLFSKNVDDLLPPGGAGNTRSPTRAAAPPTQADEQRSPELTWWVSALGGGIAISLLFFLRVLIRGIGDGFGRIDWVEFGGISCLVFAGGCVLGLAFWGFDWLKCRVARSRSRARGR